MTFGIVFKKFVTNKINDTAVFGNIENIYEVIKVTTRRVAKVDNIGLEIDQN